MILSNFYYRNVLMESKISERESIFVYRFQEIRFKEKRNLVYEASTKLLWRLVPKDVIFMTQNLSLKGTTWIENSTAELETYNQSWNKQFSHKMLKVKSYLFAVVL